MKKGLLLILVSCFFPVMRADFSENWRMMQEEYKQLQSVFSPRMAELESQFMHPYWKNQKDNMARIIRGREDHAVLTKGPISGPMVRPSRCRTQEYEIVCLSHCISESTKQLIARFSDTDFGGIPRSISEFNCSINALGQLYFFAKMLERNRPENIHLIIELGGGYGCLARVAKMILPSITYVLIDLPEYLVIQALFLRSTLPGVTIKVHTALPESFEPGIVHLVPVFLLSDLTINADLFISTAALSETPEYVQKLVVEKRFFDAPSSYITGQLNQWGSDYNFVHHGIVMQGIRSCYDLCFAQPLHHFEGSLHNYEIYGTRIKPKKLL